LAACSTPPPATSSLFSPSFADWESDPEASFLHWMAEKHFSESTARVYGYMWSKFNKWKAGRGFGFADIHANHLQAFLDDSNLEKHHRYRYVRLIERVYAVLAKTQPGLANPGSQAAKENVGRGANDLGAFLNESQRDQLIAALGCEKEKEKKKGKANDWRVLRDRTIAAVILGGGVKGGELRGMSVSCVTAGGEWLEIRHGKRQHRTRLRPFAVDLLARWVAYRAETATEGTLLFPSTIKAKLKSQMMDKATLYRIVKRLIDAAGVTLPAREAPQTLRNTFAALLFDAGESDGLVAEYLGLQDTASAGRLRAHYKIMLASADKENTS
jgi:integrase